MEEGVRAIDQSTVMSRAAGPDVAGWIAAPRRTCLNAHRSAVLFLFAPGPQVAFEDPVGHLPTLAGADLE